MKQNQTKKWWIIVVIILTGLVIVASLGDDEISNSAKENDSVQKDSITKDEQRKHQTISAEKLYAAYEANEVNADQSFKGKSIYVTGIIKNIKKDFRNNILYITLETGRTLTSVNCYFDDEKTAAKLRKGQKVVFKGTCEGLQFTTVIIRNCESAKKPE